MAFQPNNQSFITYENQQKLSEPLTGAAEDAWQKLTHRHPKLLEIPQIQQDKIKWHCGLSDFITQSMLADPDFIVQQLNQPHTPEQQFENATYHFKQALNKINNLNELHKLLRVHRREQMSWVAWQDLDGSLPLDTAFKHISDLADLFISSALEWLYQQECLISGTPSNSEGEPQPLIVLGMGKLGGGELNFSSDIDLIYCYPESGNTVGGRREYSNHEFFTRLGQKLITALHQMTADGYVYRVDMRLRPYGDSGPLVMSFAMLEDYYAEQGRGWERYAMLKARIISPESWQTNPALEQLENLIRPFVYRRYIDFSAFESLRKMKKLIKQENRRQGLSNNIKLGEGGIREVEFVVQAFQLIRGGREPELQIRSTREALQKLLELEELGMPEVELLKQGYYFLRKTEHVLQQIADQQTQTLPDDELNQQRLIFSLGINSWVEFTARLKQHMSEIHEIWQNVIHDEEDVHEQHENFDYWIVNLDTEIALSHLKQDHPDIDADSFWAQIRSTQELTQKKNMGPRGRDVLNKLMPILIELCLESEQSVQLIEQVKNLITSICTRTAYLELLFENQNACKQLLNFLVISPWISNQLCAQPFLLDELLVPKQLHKTLTETQYQAELRERLLRIEPDDLEAQMDALRQFKLAFQLRIAAADIMGELPIMKVSDHLTWLAEAILDQVVNIAWHQLEQKHGVPESLADTDHKGFAVIGYGKLGGWELGYGSDLDLVFIHDRNFNEQTTGPSQIGITQFYTRLAQRIMHIFSTQMHSGILYEMDLRLRPSGASGLLVATLEGFENYQLNEAWTWEHQALARARNILGDNDLLRKLSEVRHKILSQPRDNSKLRTDVIEMREKMFNHLSEGNQDKFDLKQDRGGITDIEFITQYLVLANAAEYPQLTVWSDNVRILTLAAELNIINPSDAEQLIEAYKVYRSTGHKLALAQQKLISHVEKYQAHIENVKRIWQGTFN